MDCHKCKYYQKNNSAISVSTKNGMMKPLKEYCQHPQVRHKEIAMRAKGRYGYPLWCPVANFKTCGLCGVTIRPEEGDYCKGCR